MNEKINITEKEFERIEKYLMGNLSPNELHQFELELQDDSNLQAKVEEVKYLLKGIETASLKSQLNQFHEELVPSKEISKSASTQSRAPIYAIAAVFVALLGLFLFFNTESESEKLFAKHFVPDPGLPTTMGTTDNFKFYDGMVNYKQEDFKTALDKWNPLLEKNPKNDTLRYFIGVAYLANGDDQKAITDLERLLNSEPKSFKNETAFYLGMAYLKLDNIEKARKYLTFSDTDSAKQVLLDIDN